ncbi:DNA-binding protein [Rosenbergiella sp. S61]|uniref:DNA-binding protein n=1 Tax=Rosenbergiella gaditana TaxID=2726987 RepID=A0ABS5T002_9GAMM|nr:DNA-binding protein [Rosenbergiella gaditana]MBT0725690.1 DNA-binding protein [Rosenbergiella gaditana]
MKEYDFSIVAHSSRDLDADLVTEIANKLYDLGADDCTVSSQNNAVIVSFDREAHSYSEAVMSAIKQLKQFNFLTVKSVDAGEFVGLSDAAELSELSRSALSKFSKGERGGGGFPTPYLRLSGKAPLYDWAEIAEWLEDKGLIEPELVENATFTRLINTALRLKSNDDMNKVSSLVHEISIA